MFSHPKPRNVNPLLTSKFQERLFITLVNVRQMECPHTCMHMAGRDATAHVSSKGGNPSVPTPASPCVCLPCCIKDSCFPTCCVGQPLQVNSDMAKVVIRATSLRWTMDVFKQVIRREKEEKLKAEQKRMDEVSLADSSSCLSTLFL